jgi:hypothetical protein
MAELFQRDKSVISRHIRNVFEEGAFPRERGVAKFATTASNGKNYRTRYQVRAATVKKFLPVQQGVNGKLRETQQLFEKFE